MSLNPRHPKANSSSPPALRPWLSSASSLPSNSGVYWFQDADGQILYIGKAKNLKQRIGTYKLARGLDPKTAKLVTVAASLHYRETDTEIDALIQEANLIKDHQPPYNRLLKDDKTPNYLYLTRPPILTLKIARRTHLPHNLAKKDIFGPFQSTAELKKLLSHLRRLFPYCSATPRQLAHRQACFYYHLKLCPGFCLGKISQSQYLERIQQIRRFLHGKKSLLIRDLKSAIKSAIKTEDFETAQTYKNQIKILELKTRPAFDFQVPYLKSGQNDERLHQLRLVLKKFLSLPANYPLDRIEGYDISNIQGKWATGSMVVSDRGSMNSSLYRQFKIRRQNTPDDPAMLSEMLERRVAHPEWGIPHAICIDGGKTQLNAAQKIIPWDIPIFSLVKNPERLLLKKAGRFYSIPLADNPFSWLLRSIRDESHRFAKRYHRKLTLNIK